MLASFVIDSGAYPLPM